MTRHRHLFWPALTTAWALGAVASAFAEPDFAVERTLVLSFCLACPGLALARLLRLDDSLAVLTIGVALTLALDVLVAGTMVYSGVWNPEVTLVLLAAVAISAAAVEAWGGIRAVDEEPAS